MSRVVESARVRASSAFAPAHLTGIFAPASSGADPRRRGSVGAGVVLELGVHATATWIPGPRRVVVRSDSLRRLPISESVADRLAPTTGALRVDLRHEVPIGQGLGASAAGALATALAVGRISGAPRRRAVEVAHLAELFGGGGLGGVAAIADGGGWERRVTAGIAPYGSVEHRTFPHAVFVVIVGAPIQSDQILSDLAFLARVRSAAVSGLRTLDANPGVDALLDVSERFTDEVGLASPAHVRLLARLRSAGAWAGQAMFGRVAWAVPKHPRGRARVVSLLERSRLRSVEIAALGARTVPSASRLAPARGKG